jgi:hypothetical protein
MFVFMYEREREGERGRERVRDGEMREGGGSINTSALHNLTDTVECLAKKCTKLLNEYKHTQHEYGHYSLPSVTTKPYYTTLGLTNLLIVNLPNNYVNSTCNLHAPLPLAHELLDATFELFTPHEIATKFQQKNHQILDEAATKRTPKLKHTPTSLTAIITLNNTIYGSSRPKASSSHTTIRHPHVSNIYSIATKLLTHNPTEVVKEVHVHFETQLTKATPYILPTPNGKETPLKTTSKSRHWETPQLPCRICLHEKHSTKTSITLA